MVLPRDYYADPVTGDVGKVLYEQIPDHVGHCINTLREAVMCSADIRYELPTSLTNESY